MKVDNKEAAFSLVELLMAIAILGIVITIFSGFLVNNIRLSTRASLRTEAINLLKIKLDEELSQGFNNITAIARQGFSGEKEGYEYSLQVISFEDDVKQLIAKVYFKKDLIDQLTTFITAESEEENDD